MLIIEVPIEYPGRNGKHSQTNELLNFREKGRIWDVGWGRYKRESPSNSEEEMNIKGEILENDQNVSNFFRGVRAKKNEK